MKNAVQISIHTLKDTWYLGRQMNHLWVQTELETVSSNVQKQVQLLSLLSMNKFIAFLLYLNKGSTVIFYLFSSALLRLGAWGGVVG
jgi:hypothetical protein